MTAAELIADLRAALDAQQEDAERGYLTAPDDPAYTGWDHATTAGLPPLISRRVLADIAAKRAVLDMYEVADAESDDYEHGQYAAAVFSVIETLAEAYGIRP